MSTATVELTNVGPIERLSIPVPENGGLVALRARNGRGKTKALEAIESLATGNGKVSVRDGALNGRVEGFGATMSVARSTRRSGELEVVTLEGKLNAADLVDPGMKSPEAADAHRIRALIQTSGVAADVSLFYPLLGGQESFERFASKAITKQDADPVELAARIKREVEAAARLEESQADTARGHAKANRDAAGEHDLTAECDAAKLQADLEAAIRRQSELESQAKEALTAAQNALQARAQLTDVQAAGLLNLTEAETKEREAAALCDKTREARIDAENALRQAKADEESAKIAWNTAIDARKAAEGQKRLVAGWEATIEAAARVQAPSADEIAAATQARDAASRAVEQGALIRDAKKRLQTAGEYQAQADEHASRAELLRNAAKGTDEVLSGLVAQLGTPLRVEAGRLVLKTNRGETYFGELSHGERWKIAIDLCVDQVGAAGLLVMPQEAFEGLDEFNRRDIAEHAQRRGVLILTAEASTDEEITAEVYA